MDLINSLFQWLDVNTARYGWVAWTAFGCTAAGVLAAPRNPAAPVGIAGRAFFAAGIVLTLVAFRWPSWFAPTDLNPDEAQMLAGAITLQRFPVYWKYVDGTTHGPLCELPLNVAGWLGAPLNYVTARVVAALLLAVSLIGAWGTLRCFAAERVARLAVLPGLAFLSLVSLHEYICYSSELSGLVLVSLATWALARVLTAPVVGRSQRVQIFFAGVVLGAVPFAKLQSAPQAAALTVIALALLGRTKKLTPPVRWSLARWLVAGGLLVPALTFTFLVVYGLVGQFTKSYILISFEYTSSGARLSEMPYRFLGFALNGYSFAWFFAGTLAFGLLYAHAIRRATPALRTAHTISWVLLGVAFACVILPGRECPHYLHLLVVPATLVAGLALAGAVERPETEGSRGPLAWTVVAWFVGLALVPQINQWTVSEHEFCGKFKANLATRSAAAKFMARLAKQSDTLAMWGWEANLYVETGLAQATREGHSALEIAATPVQAFYMNRYLSDMRRHQPEWFVDAVGPGGFQYEDRSLYGHEMYPGLRDLVASQYELVGEFENKRVYHRKNGL